MLAHGTNVPSDETFVRPDYARRSVLSSTMRSVGACGLGYGGGREGFFFKLFILLFHTLHSHPFRNGLVVEVVPLSMI